MGYQHLTIGERECVVSMRYAGAGVADIARKLSRCPSTIYRELKRNASTKGYIAHKAQWLYERRHSRASRRLKHWPDKLMKYVMDKLVEDWSPEQIAGSLVVSHPRSFRMRISFATLYRWIRQDRAMGGKLYKLLRRKGKRYKRSWSHDTRGRFNDVPCISERPKAVDDMRRYGDWECDTVFGAQGSGCMVSINERKSRYLVVRKMERFSALELNKAVFEALEGLPPRMLRTMTVDRGKEFARYKELRTVLGISVYFAQPYSAWQRGQNENLNGLLRQYFPKGTNLRNVSQQEIDRVVERINNRPRKCLGFRSPAEALKTRARCTSLDNPPRKKSLRPS